MMAAAQEEGLLSPITVQLRTVQNQQLFSTGSTTILAAALVADRDRLGRGP
jgi:hypothetical protein